MLTFGRLRCLPFVIMVRYWSRHPRVMVWMTRRYRYPSFPPIVISLPFPWTPSIVPIWRGVGRPIPSPRFICRWWTPVPTWWTMWCSMVVRRRLTLTFLFSLARIRFPRRCLRRVIGTSRRPPTRFTWIPVVLVLRCPRWITLTRRRVVYL